MELCVFLHPQSEFFTDFTMGTSGKLKGDEQLRRSDFALKLTTLVEAGDLTGYYAEVTRELDLEKRWTACRLVKQCSCKHGQLIPDQNIR